MIEQEQLVNEGDLIRDLEIEFDEPEPDKQIIQELFVQLKQKSVSAYINALNEWQEALFALDLDNTSQT
jgi:hypothetical protein